ncbi:MAG TPA: S8 family serine peptidase, partial [Candidatus Binatia bacterium]|nr:S8 family serine peptidase [Candidatus Binatia bacterium]
MAVLGAVLVAAPAAAGPRLPGPRGKTAASLRAGRAARVQVYVHLRAVDPAARAALGAAGLALELVDAERRIAQGRIASDRLADLAALPVVTRVAPADRARPRRGAVTSEGDLAARADLVRADGFDGTGIVVGVVSDGADGIAASQATGDLPEVTVPLDEGCLPGEGEEGTAMLEVVHDLAPGARLLFSGAATSLEFVAAVRCLVAAGARVIVDDLGFYGEPYFRDGAVALAARAAVVAGVSYVTAAGNDAQGHVEQLFRPALCGDFHAFGPGSSDCTEHVVVAPFDALDCTLQWNDPFGEAANDYDLLLVDENGDLLVESDDPQQGAEDPIERIEWTNPDAVERRLGIRVRREAGEARVLEMFCHGGRLEYLSPASSVFGHAAVTEVLTVAAIDVADPGRDDVEPFSSRGPAHLFFPVEDRAKPDLAAFDQVATTVPGLAPFVGTSAAAPHVAAVAALLLAKNPFLAPVDVAAALRAGAVDVGPLGPD